MERNIHEILDCLPDGDEDESDVSGESGDGLSMKMDWQPESCVVIPQKEETQYCWDDEGSFGDREGVGNVEKVPEEMERQGEDIADGDGDSEYEETSSKRRG